MVSSCSVNEPIAITSCYMCFQEEASARLTKANGDENKNMVIWTSSLTSRDDVSELVSVDDYIVRKCTWYLNNY